jgi:hypothetical protein
MTLGVKWAEEQTVNKEIYTLGNGDTIIKLDHFIDFKRIRNRLIEKSIKRRKASGNGMDAIANGEVYGLYRQVLCGRGPDQRW